ncbi:MAG: hypothetical protein Q4E53_07015 [Eubacteriales bacterium]|nr:hypothetical protein [Eubacteriales bacterium]
MHRIDLIDSMDHLSLTTNAITTGLIILTAGNTISNPNMLDMIQFYAETLKDVVATINSIQSALCEIEQNED